VFRELLDSYIKTCDEIVMTSCNSVMLFEAGEKAASELTDSSEMKKMFERDGMEVSFENKGEEVVFSLRGFPVDKLKGGYSDMFRGFFGEAARRIFKAKYLTREYRVEDNTCIFIVGLIR